MPIDPRDSTVEERLRRTLTTVADTQDPVENWPGVLAIDPDATAPNLSASSSSPRSGSRRVLAVAAIVIVVAGVAGLARWAGTAGPTHVEASDPSSTLDRPEPTSVSVVTAQASQQLTVDPGTLPNGVHFIDETTRDGAGIIVEARFARDADAWRGDGPYVRITAYPLSHADTKLIDRARAANPNVEITEVQGHPAFTSSDAEAAPTVRDRSGTGGSVTNPWITLSWADGPTLVFSVTTKGVTEADRRAIAESLRYSPGAGSGLTATTTTQPSCDLSPLLDLGAYLPASFSPSPHAGIGGDPSLTNSCGRYWTTAPGEGTHITQIPGTLPETITSATTAGSYRWGPIHEGYAIEHLTEPRWYAVAYGMTANEIETVADGLWKVYPTRRATGAPTPKERPNTPPPTTASTTPPAEGHDDGHEQPQVHPGRRDLHHQDGMTGDRSRA